MLVFRTLGTLDLRAGSGVGVPVTLAQPKRVALLAYLALATPPGFHRRDTLLGLFWPELDQERARNALRQALYHLRRSLGEGVLVNRGDDDLGLDPGAVECDAAQFQQALAEGRLADALVIYKGGLLPGFYLTDCPEFERWLESERTRLHGLAAGAALALAQTDLERDPSAAPTWAERALALNPDSEAALRILMTARDRTGNRAAAIRAYETFARRLAREYQIEPSPETKALILKIRTAAPTAGTATVSPVEAPRDHIPASIPIAIAEPAPAPPRRSKWSLARIGLLVLLLSLGIGALQPVLRLVRPQPGEAGARLIVVVPFRVSGADQSLQYLREGMLDLLATKLVGEGGLLAADPRSVMTAWHQMGVPDSVDLPAEDALRLARRLGGTRLLFGGIVGRPERLIVTASVLEASSGQTLARAGVEGRADSLPEMIDRLTAVLLSRQAGEDELRISALSGTSLPALRAYLEGQSLYRGGHYDQAVAHFEQAIALDSNFALAGMGLAASGIWFPTAEASRQRGFEIAWRHRDRLAPADRTFLTALAGPRYPAISSWKERLDAWEAAVRVAPGRPDAWYEYGDILFHRGPMLGMSASRALAAAAFGRALALDSAFAAPISHLLDVAAAAGDSAAVRRYAGLYLRSDSNSDLAEYVRWRSAVMTGDEAALDELRQRFGTMATGSLWRIAGGAQLDGIAMEDAERAAAVLRLRAATRVEHFEITRFLMDLALNQGRPAQAQALADALSDDGAVPNPGLSEPVLNAVYADGDSGAAARVASRLERSAGLPLPEDPTGRAGRLWQLCDLGQWRVWRGELDGIEEWVRLLKSAAPPAVPSYAPSNLGKCAAILDAAVAVMRKSKDAAVRVSRLDSLMLSVPEADPREVGNLALARLRELQGDPAGALAAIRRRQYHQRGGLPFLARFLRDEGRLAALTGDRDGARRAYRHYLTLRANPEPQRAGEVARVEGELKNLE